MDPPQRRSAVGRGDGKRTPADPRSRERLQFNRVLSRRTYVRGGEFPRSHPLVGSHQRTAVAPLQHRRIPHRRHRLSAGRSRPGDGGVGWHRTDLGPGAVWLAEAVCPECDGGREALAGTRCGGCGARLSSRLEPGGGARGLCPFPDEASQACPCAGAWRSRPLDRGPRPQGVPPSRSRHARVVPLSCSGRGGRPQGPC